MSLSVDQFLVIRDLDRNPNVVSFLSEHLKSGSLQINRVAMGSANETAYRDFPVTQRFQFAVSGSYHPETRPVAVLDHVDRLQAFHAIHKAGFNTVGMGGRVPSPECCITDGDVSVAAVYHYLYKSVEEYRYDLCRYNCTPGGEPGTRHVPNYRTKHQPKGIENVTFWCPLPRSSYRLLDGNGCLKLTRLGA